MSKNQKDKELKELKDENKSLKDQIAKLKEENEAHERDGISESEHKRIVDELNSKIVSLEASASEYSDDANEKLVLAEQKIEELTTQLEQFTADGGVSKEEVAKMQKTIKELTEQVKQKTVYTQLEVITDKSKLEKGVTYKTGPNGRGWVKA